MTIQRLQAQLHPVTNNKKHTQIDRGLQQSPSSKAVTNLNFMGNNYKPISFKASLSEDQQKALEDVIRVKTDSENMGLRENAIKDRINYILSCFEAGSRLTTLQDRDEHNRTRGRSAIALGNIASSHKDVAIEITDNLTQVFQEQEQNNFVREESGRSLGLIARSHKDLAPRIIDNLTQVFQNENQNIGVNVRSISTLKEIARSHKDLAPTIIDNLTQVFQDENQDNLVHELSERTLEEIASFNN